MLRALVVDDKSENLYLLSAIFMGNGYLVDKAANGIEALASARINPPDLVISDILMPGMDGFSLCREWKQDTQLQHIPFIFYTATYTDSKDEEFALSLGADLFLIKPQEPDVFINQIDKVLRQHQTGQLQSRATGVMEEKNYLKEYNAALIHKLEDKLLQLERANKIRNILLSSVSHELRTPLTPAMLLLELIIHDPQIPPHIRADLDAIHRHIELETHLISDLLEYAAMHTGATQLLMQPLLLHDMLQKTFTLWQGQIRANDLRLAVHLEAQNHQILGNRERMEQVLWNLMHHAVRRSPQQGAITFRTWNSPADQLTLEVRDAGESLGAEAVAWAFAPFEHETRMGEGGRRNLGLGLAVSKGIIDAHGGSIKIQNAGQDSGASVIVQLPTDQASIQLSGAMGYPLRRSAT